MFIASNLTTIMEQHNQQIIHIRSEEELAEFAKAFAHDLEADDVVELVGDLGAGKTTFVRALGMALGITDKIKSPTFTVMQEYRVSDFHFSRLLHLDLYRFTKVEELESLALHEELNGQTVLMIEWPNAVSGLPIKTTKRLQFTITSETSREIRYERL